MGYRRPNLIESIKEQEGTGPTDHRNGDLVFLPYDDSDDELNDIVGKEGDLEGHVSIAWGRNLTVNGVRESEAELMLKNDLDDIENFCRQMYEFWPDLSRCRQNVLMEMVYHMGPGDFMKFEKMIGALQKGDMDTAADELVDSDYGWDYPERSDELAEQLRSDVLQ